MSAMIKVEGGANAGLAFPIEEEVFRVGAAPACKLRLADPGLPAHVATVEFRKGGYLVHNRSGKPLAINGQPLRANASSPWQSGQGLELGDGLVLRLVVSGDAAPAKRQTVVNLTEPSNGGSAGAESGKAAALARPLPKAKQRAQIAVIVLCGVVVVAAVFYKLLANDTDVPGTPPKERSALLIEELRSRLEGGDAAAEPVLALLQKARVDELRGSQAAARRAYGELVLLLKRRQQPDGTITGDSENKLYGRVLKLARSKIRIEE